jgi:parvulin-like peptidyl-prolyl isomerase
MRVRGLTLLLVLALAASLAVAQEIPPPTQREAPAPPGTAEVEEPGEQAGQWQLVEAIVAWINDDIITVSELTEAEQQLSADLRRSMTGEELDSALVELQRDLLYRLIEQRLLVQKAEQMYDMTKLRESLLDQVKKQQGIQSEEELSQMLRQSGMSLDELTSLLVDNNTPAWIIQAEVTDTLSVSDAEVEAYFEEHRNELGEESRVTFREIVLRGEGEELEALRARAGKVVADARSGIDFIELVQAVSESPSKDSGGLIGPIARDDLAGWLAGPAFELPVGEVSDPIQAPFGWQILKIEERSEAVAPDLESSRNEIEMLIRDEKFRPAFADFILGLWNGSEIYVAQDFVSLLPPEWQGRVLTRQ